MSSPSSVPAHTVVGARSRGDRLAAQEFHLVLVTSDRAGTSFPVRTAEVTIGKQVDKRSKIGIEGVWHLQIFAHRRLLKPRQLRDSLPS